MIQVLMMMIFELKVKSGGFKLFYDTNDENGDKRQIVSLFSTNHKYFPNNGGDVETLFLNCKIAHSRSMVGKREEEKYEFSFSDISKGFKAFRSSRDYKNLAKKQKTEENGSYS